MSDRRDRRDDAADRARDEFFSEASELVEGFGRNVLLLEESVDAGAPADAERLNEIFRAVHTLKGLSGLFGAVTLSGLSHELENLLDDLRLGRISVSTAVLDLLFDAVELYGAILAALKGERPEPREEVSTLLASLAAVTNERAGSAGVIAEYELDPGTLGVLTEYEEHRLRSSLQGGLFLYRLRAKFPLSSIDTALEELKVRVRPVGEIITYLPTGDGAELDSIDLEILVASRVSHEELVAAIASDSVHVEEVRKRDLSQARTPPAPRAEPRRTSPPVAPDRLQTSPPAARHSSPAPPDFDGRQNQGSQDAPRLADAIPFISPRDVSLRSVAQTVRVDIKKLDSLMNALGELSLVRGSLLRLSERLRSDPSTRRLSQELFGIHRTFERQLEQMQNGILEVRMVPLGQVFDKLARIVRQISRDQGKSVHFVVTGGETEIDKLIVEELSDPLLHMIRNAIDHGIEGADERSQLGKPETGTVALNAYQQGNHVVIEVEDDGRGIDPDVVRRVAVERGHISLADAEALSREETLLLIFAAGFSTRSEVDTVSGRGVGMDIVKTRMAKMGGLVDISSEVRMGTKVVLNLPVTLAIVGVLTFDVAHTTYCVPLSTMEEAIVLDERHIRVVDQREFLSHRGVTLPIVRLGALFSEPDWELRKTAKQFLIVARVGHRRLGMVVDRLIEQAEVVIKALGPALGGAPGFAGATDLGEGKIALILDVPALVNECLSPPDRNRTGDSLAGELRGGGPS